MLWLRLSLLCMHSCLARCFSYAWSFGLWRYDDSLPMSGWKPWSRVKRLKPGDGNKKCDELGSLEKFCGVCRPSIVRSHTDFQFFSTKKPSAKSKTTAHRYLRRVALFSGCYQFFCGLCIGLERKQQLEPYHPHMLHRVLCQYIRDLESSADVLERKPDTQRTVPDIGFQLHLWGIYRRKICILVQSRYSNLSIRVLGRDTGPNIQDVVIIVGGLHVNVPRPHFSVPISPNYLSQLFPLANHRRRFASFQFRRENRVQHRLAPLQFVDVQVQPWRHRACGRYEDQSISKTNAIFT